MMSEAKTPHGIGRRFQDAWNAHDMVRFAALFHPEASFVNRFATYWKGTDAIVAGHRDIHESIYRDSVLIVDAPEVEMLSENVAIAHFWTRLSAGTAHPAGPHQVDTLVLSVLTIYGGEWRIRAAENVTLADPRSGRPVLRTAPA